MVKKVPIGKPVIIKYKGLFDFDGLYNLISQWIKSSGFWFHEKTYKHKVPSPAGAEEEIIFQGTREKTELYKHTIDVYIHIWDMTEVEVEIGGKKKTLTNARIEIVINGLIEVDYDNKFQKNAFLAGLFNFYTRRSEEHTSELQSH